MLGCIKNKYIQYMHQKPHNARLKRLNHKKRNFFFKQIVKKNTTDDWNNIGLIPYAIF